MDNIKKIHTYSTFKQDVQKNNLSETDFTSKYMGQYIKLDKRIEESGDKKTMLVEIKPGMKLTELLLAFDMFNKNINDQNREFKAKIKAIQKDLKNQSLNTLKDNNIKKADNISSDLLNKYFSEVKNDEILNKSEKINEKTIMKPKHDEYEIINMQSVLSNPDVVKNMASGSGSTFLAIGSSKSGKTSLMVKFGMMFYKLYPKTNVILISDSYTLNAPKYQLLKDNIDEGHLNIVSPTKLTDAINLAESMQKETGGQYPLLFLLDDIITQKNNKHIMKLFLTLRNLNISTFMCLQSCMLFHKSSRGNVNYIFAGKLNNNECIEEFYEKFLKGTYSGKKEYEKDYIKDTADYGKLFIDNLNGKLYHFKD